MLLIVTALKSGNKKKKNSEKPLRYFPHRPSASFFSMSFDMKVAKVLLLYPWQDIVSICLST